MLALEADSSGIKALSVAIKKLYHHDDKDFEKERTILVALETKRNDHLVKLLFSYEYKGSYHLVFRRAQGNLRDYWEQKPELRYSPELVLWSLKQMSGIAQGLYAIHNFKVTIPLSMSNTEMQTPQGQALMSVSQGEERFGRHGDLKPENIIWFPTADGGLCQITDFGLGRFHGRDTRTKAAPYTIYSSPTYEPPECHIFMPVSRAYDMWSIGCIFLEWVSWILKGWKGVEDFSVRRVEESFILNDQGKIKDDYFWSLLLDGNRRGAKVRSGVEQWVRHLREDPNCSALIHDLLSLIMKDLLCIDPTRRCKADMLNRNLHELFIKAKTTPDYVLRPKPWVPKASDHNTYERSHAALLIFNTDPAISGIKPLHCRTWPTAELGNHHSETISTVSPSRTAVRTEDKP